MFLIQDVDGIYYTKSSPRVKSINIIKLDRRRRVISKQTKDKQDSNLFPIICSVELVIHGWYILEFAINYR